MSETTADTTPPDSAPLPPGDQANAPAADPQAQSVAQPKQDDAEGPLWYQKRLQRYAEAERGILRERDAARAEAEALRRQAAEREGRAQAPQPETPEQVEARVRDQMQRQQTLDRFNERCNAVATAISSTLGQEALAAAARGFTDVGLDFTRAEHRDLVDDIADLPNPAEVYHYLGTHRDEAAHILELAPRAQARALAEVAARVGASTAGGSLAAAPPPARAVSAAPPPPGRTPPPARSSSRSIYDPSMSMEEWVAMRDKKR